MKKRFLCILICLLQTVLLFCGCKGFSYVAESTPVKAKESYVPSGTLATKGDYSLLWDSERCSLAVLKNGNVVWASMPIDQYISNTKGGAVKKYIESHIIVDYKDETTNTLTREVSYIGALENGRIYSYLVEDGIRILYCFDKLYFAVPVIYRLRDGYLDVMVENKGIYECGNEIYRISVLPYSASVENSAENRIFVPDGSGMIMNCGSGRGKREYSADVFGHDGAEPAEYKFLYEEKIHLPVFAIGSNQSGTFCTIINEGATAAAINASAGDDTIGYSYAYAAFRIRGTQTVKIPQGWGKVSITGQYSDISRSNRMQMRICFLDEYDKSFLNVAEYYRDYLKKEKGLKKSSAEQTLYIDIPMALSQRKFFFGFPYDTVKAVTTYSQAQDILSEIYKRTKVAPVVRLSGIQSGGLEVSRIAGGYKLEGALGNSEQFEALLSKAKDIGVSIFPDFDVTRFRKNSAGFSVKSDSVRSSTSLSSPQYFYSISTGEVADNSYVYYLLTPPKVVTAVQELIPRLDKFGFNNVSLSTLGEQFYSDYNYERGYVGGDYTRAVKSINKLLKENKIKIMYNSANEYSAVCASHIINSPTNSSNYNAQDEWIPFYQMVFKGYVPMSCNSINLADIDRDEFLRAVQTGIGINFTVCGDETLDYSTSKFPQLLAGSYENSKDLITDMAEEFNQIADKIGNTEIVGFEMIADGVYATDFSSGETVIVNYTDKDYSYGQITINSKNYVFYKGGD